MNPADRFLEVNRQTWDQKVDIHLNSDFYDQENFIKGKSSLKEVELALLGDVTGKRILHLQCHFGQDSISLARMGAHVTAIDLSPKAVQTANELNKTCGTAVDFVCSDLYSLPENLTGQFDIVFTSYGTIMWLPDLDRWARVIQHFLTPGGKFIMAEFHPVVWMYDDDFREASYGYFNRAPIVETTTGTYADPNAPVSLQTVTWNHPTSEVLNALIQAGLELEAFHEFDFSPWNCFRHTIPVGPDRFQIQHLAGKIPITFSLCCVRK